MIKEPQTRGAHAACKSAGWNRLFLTILVTSIAAGCADRSDPSGTGLPELPVAEDSIPSLRITFPISGASAEGVDTLVVTGQLEDLADGLLTETDITAFSVNDVPAQLNLETGRWSAAIPLEQGDVEIRARIESRSGHRDVDTVILTNTTPPLDYDFISVSPDGNNLYVVTAASGGILSKIDLTNNNRTMVRDELLSQQSSYLSSGIRIASAQDTAYLLRYSGDPFRIKPDVLSVNLIDGQAQSRGDLPFAREGRHEFLYYYPDFDVDEQARRLVLTLNADLVYDPSDACWLSVVDLESGERDDIVQGYQVSGPLDGFYPDLCPGPVVIDPDNNRAIVAADNRENGLVEISDFKGLYAYDLTTGERSVVSDEFRGGGPALSAPTRLFRTSDNNKVIALDPSGVVEVNTLNGDREMRLATPQLPEDTSDIAFDEANNRLLFAHRGNTISALDLATGELDTVLSFSRAVGTGPEISPLSLRIMDSSNQRILGLPPRGNTLIEVDLKTLERKVIAPDLGVNDTSRMEVSAAVLNQAGTHLYYAIDKSFIRQGDRSDIMVLDLHSGTVTRVSANASSSGPELRRTHGLSLDRDGGLLYLTAEYGRPARPGVLSVDIATGTRRLVSPASQGPDQIGATLTKHLMDDDGKRIIALTEEGALTGINVDSGSRETLVPPAPEAQPFYIQDIAWDVAADTVLFLESFRDEPSLRLQSVSLSSGQRNVLMEGIYDFVFDRVNSRIFFSGHNAQTQATALLATDRDKPGEVVIARPD